MSHREEVLREERVDADVWEPPIIKVNLTAGVMKLTFVSCQP